MALSTFACGTEEQQILPLPFVQGQDDNFVVGGEEG